MKLFCTTILRPCHQAKADWKDYSEDPCSYFHGYYEFEKIGEDRYRYYVREPYAD